MARELKTLHSISTWAFERFAKACNRPCVHEGTGDFQAIEHGEIDAGPKMLKRSVQAAAPIERVPRNREFTQTGEMQGRNIEGSPPAVGQIDNFSSSMVSPCAFRKFTPSHLTVLERERSTRLSLERPSVETQIWVSLARIPHQHRHIRRPLKILWIELEVDTRNISNRSDSNDSDAVFIRSANPHASPW